MSAMLSVSEAIAAVLQTASAFEPQPMPLAESLGLVLAEDVHSNTDLPPFDKSLVDGFAIRLRNISAESESSSFAVLEVVSAGQVPTRKLTDEVAAIQIMTGAPLPVGAD